MNTAAESVALDARSDTSEQEEVSPQVEARLVRMEQLLNQQAVQQREDIRDLKELISITVGSIGRLSQAVPGLAQGQVPPEAQPSFHPQGFREGQDPFQVPEQETWGGKGPRAAEAFQFWRDREQASHQPLGIIPEVKDYCHTSRGRVTFAHILISDARATCPGRTRPSRRSSTSD